MTFFAGLTVSETMNILPPSFNSVPRIGYFLCNTCFFLHIFSNHNRAQKKKGEIRCEISTDGCRGSQKEEKEEKGIKRKEKYL